MIRPDAALPAERASFLESGVSLAVATRGANGRPDCVLAMGLRVAPDRRRVTLFLPERPSARCLRNLSANGAVAVTASRPDDYQTLQLKGRAVRIAPATAEDHAFVRAYRDALVARLEAIGYSRALVGRLGVWPCLAVEIALDALFEQTPGPRAGAILET